MLSGSKTSETVKKTNRIANHALFFMIQGLAARFQVPVGHYFVRGTINKERLSSLIVEIVREVNKTGLNVVFTVCDEGSTNVGAKNILMKRNRIDQPGSYFFVDDCKIFWLFDDPHLWKRWKENISGNVEHWLKLAKETGNINATKFDFPGNVLYWDGKTFRWRFIIDLYLQSLSNCSWTKVGSINIFSTGQSSMRVKNTTQTLSHTVAENLRCSADALVSLYEKRGTPVTKWDILETADVIDDLDKMIDCMNGSSSKDDVKSSTSRANVSKSSNHLDLWSRYRRILRDAKIKNWNGDKKRPPCQDGLIQTLSAMQDVWHVLQAYGFTELCLRHLNQDPNENTFGLIRQLGGDNDNPTIEQFDAAMTSLYITRFSSQHFPVSNCEEDNGHMLINLQEFACNKCLNDKIATRAKDDINVDNVNDDSISDSHDYPAPTPPPVLHLEEFDDSQFVYDEKQAMFMPQLIGYIVRCLSTIKKFSCETCIKCIKFKNSAVIGGLSISADVIAMVKTAVNVLTLIIATNLSSNNILEDAMQTLTISCDTTWMDCQDHGRDIIRSIYRRITTILIRAECQKLTTEIKEAENRSRNARKIAQQKSEPK